MAKKPETYRVTVDFETDWGGRTETVQGLEEGLPFILETFRAYKVRGLFFVSTELLKNYAGFIRNIKDHGHEIGSHGHFHEVFKSKERQSQNLDISRQLLAAYKMKVGNLEYRMPKFSYPNTGTYASRENHYGLLRTLWWLDKPKDILYLHPFDLVKPVTKAPNLFCKLWYSRPSSANLLLTKLVKDIHEDSIHKRA